MTTKRRGEAPPVEVAYFRAIEEDFLGRRGEPLLLSSADWDLIWKWHVAALPLRVVLRGIADAFEGHAHSWGRNKKVGSLSYCAGEVDRARERWRRALSLERKESLGASSTLDALAKAWSDAAAPSALDATVSDVVKRLRESDGGNDVGPTLRALETKARGRMVAVAGEALVARWRADVRAALEGYRGRMPDRTLSRIEEEGVTRRLFEHFGLPRLALME